MKLYKSSTDLLYCLISYIEITFLCLYGDILPPDCKAMMWGRDIFNLIHESPFLYTLNFVLLCIAAVYLLNRQLPRKIFRWSHCLAYATTIVAIIIFAARHPRAIEYDALAFSFVFILFLLECGKYFDGIHKSKTIKDGKQGFVTDSSRQEDLQNVGWEKYAESLLERLRTTNTCNTSFAIALTGGWGTGKTTFLGYLKEDMRKNRLTYMDFNPWLSSSTETIIQDFFRTLSRKLNEQGIELNDEIDEYVKLLFRWGKRSLFDKVGEIVQLDENKDLASLRDKLSQGLDFLEDNLYVLIDDIDRLQGKEIFEVLKLIRNTADFNHIVYVVTCDKEYICQSLQNQIKRPNEYLKKIFQMELKFPLYEEYLLTHLFNTELQAHTHYDAVIQNQLNQLELYLNNSKIYLKDYFANFRDAKRLVNIFILNLDYIYKQGVVADFNIKDLFLILLLEFTDEDGFKLFRKNLWKILHVYSSDHKYIELVNTEELDKYKFCDRTKQLLVALFPPLKRDNSMPPRNSIRRQDKVLTYFSFRPYAYQMSLTDFSNLLKCSSQETIRTYIQDSNVGVFSKASSIYQMMKEQWLKGLDETSIENFLFLLTAWTKKYNGYDIDKIGSLYRDVLSKNCIDEDNVNMIKEVLHYYFEPILDTLQGIMIRQKILCKMVPCFVDQDYDGNEEYFPECIYDLAELHNMIKENTQRFLHLVKPRIEQFLEKSRLISFISNSVVYNDSYTPMFDSFPIEGDLIAYFTEHKEMNTIKPFIDKFDKTKYPGDTDEERIEAMYTDIRKRFACIKFYKRFLKECFVHSEGDNILTEYLERNRLWD